MDESCVLEDLRQKADPWPSGDFEKQAASLFGQYPGHRTGNVLFGPICYVSCYEVPVRCAEAFAMVFPEWITLSRFCSSPEEFAYQRIVEATHKEPAQF